VVIEDSALERRDRSVLPVATRAAAAEEAWLGRALAGPVVLNSGRR
jgi:hypothetical protein